MINRDGEHEWHNRPIFRVNYDHVWSSRQLGTSEYVVYHYDVAQVVVDVPAMAVMNIYIIDTGKNEHVHGHGK